MPRGGEYLADGLAFPGDPQVAAAPHRSLDRRQAPAG
jgi:hypothetical protein